jgi:putative intracellular protease/amidase
MVLKKQHTGRRRFEPRLVAAEPGSLQLITGVSILPQETIADVAHTDIVFVPNVMAETAKDMKSLDRRLLSWIKRMHAQGAQIYAACGGSLVLAEAGLLEGQQATTHWSYAPLFRRHYPKVTLRRNVFSCRPASVIDRLLRRRLLLARSGASAHRPARRYARSHSHREGLSLPVAPRRPAALRLNGRQRRPR